MMGLTKMQARCLAVIREVIATNGIAPTYLEIGAVLNVQRSRVFHLVRGLEARGAIRTLPGKARAIELVDDLQFLTPDLRRAVQAFADQHHIKPETAVAEAVRAYCGVAA